MGRRYASGAQGDVPGGALDITWGLWTCIPESCHGPETSNSDVTLGCLLLGRVWTITIQIGGLYISEIPSCLFISFYADFLNLMTPDLDNSLLWGTCQCIVGCSAESLASIH